MLPSTSRRASQPGAVSRAVPLSDDVDFVAEAPKQKNALEPQCQRGRSRHAERLQIARRDEAPARMRRDARDRPLLLAPVRVLQQLRDNLLECSR